MGCTGQVATMLLPRIIRGVRATHIVLAISVKPTNILASIRKTIFQAQESKSLLLLERGSQTFARA